MHCLNFGIFSFVKDGGGTPGVMREEEMSETEPPVINSINGSGKNILSVIEYLLEKKWLCPESSFSSSNSYKLTNDSE